MFQMLEAMEYDSQIYRGEIFSRTRLDFVKKI